MQCQICYYQMDRSLSRQQRDQNQFTYILYTDFSKYLEQLDLVQRTQLQDFITSHHQIQVVNKDTQKYLKSRHHILKDLDYVITRNQHRRQQHSTISASSVSYTQIKRNIQHCSQLAIERDNYLEMIKQIMFIKTINQDLFQVCITDKHEEQSSSNSKKTIKSLGEQIFITNKCIGVSKIFMVFNEYIEIMELQSLVDIEWKLQTIQQIIQRFENEKLKLFVTPYKDKEIFFFKREQAADWNKFIIHINQRTIFSYMIVTKFKYFQEITQRKMRFNATIKLAMSSSQISFREYSIVQAKVIEPEVSIASIKKIALSVISANFRQYKYDSTLLDAITCFNITPLQDKCSELLLVRPAKNNKKNYIYFTFYNTFMEIIQHQDKSIFFIQRGLAQEIENNLYRNIFAEIKKMSIAYQLPFFYFCQDIKEVKEVAIKALTRVQENEGGRLLYYKYWLNLPQYKIQLYPDVDQKVIFDKYEKNWILKFKSAEIEKKIGKIKSESIQRKFRETNGNVCIEGKRSFCQHFVDKCLLLIQN